MSTEVAEAIRQTRRTLTEKTWVPGCPDEEVGEVCALTAVPGSWYASPDITWGTWEAFAEVIGWYPEFVGEVADGVVEQWNDRQIDVGAVLGMTLQALIAELCKPTLAPRTTEA